MKMIDKKTFTALTSVFIFSVLCGCGVKPTIISDPRVQAQVEDTYEYVLKSEGAKPITYSTQEAPKGFRIDNSGKAIWIPQEKGEFEVLISAQNPYGKDQQGYSIKVKEKTLSPAYKDGKKWGKNLWDKDTAKGFVYILVMELIKNYPEYTKNPSFESGLLKGYNENKPQNKDNMPKLSSKEVIEMILSAGSQKQPYKDGESVGKKLRNSKITVEQATKAKQQSSLGESSKKLAWKSGFINGYINDSTITTQNYHINENNKKFQWAIRVYFGLPDPSDYES